MNCKDLGELLSAYADGELAGTQRDFLDEHLASCADCRVVLADYTQIRQQLLSLRVTRPLPDIREATMSKIKMVKVPVGLRRWLRPALVAAPILVVLITLLSLYLSGFFLSTGVIAKAYAAMEGVRSYRLTSNGYHKELETDELVHSWRASLEYVSPDRYHLIAGYPEGYLDEYLNEAITIGDQVYIRVAHSVPDVEEFGEFTPSREQTLETLDIIVEIEAMPDEVIDGADYYHYRGMADIEKWLEKGRPARERRLQGMIDRNPGLNLEDALKAAEDGWRTREVEYELWISKDDYLIRRWKETIQPLPGEPPIANRYHTLVTVFDYYDFNEPIVIEPPLTESGELLPDWSLHILE
jgi:hypothetical protein